MTAQVPQTGNTSISQYDTEGTHSWQSAANHCRPQQQNGDSWEPHGQLGATWSSTKQRCIRSLDKSAREAIQQLIVDVEAEGTVVRS